MQCVAAKTTDERSSLSAVVGWLLLLVVGWALMMQPVRAEEDYLDPEDAFQFSAAMHSPTELDIHFVIAPEYYMYRDRFVFEAMPSSDWLGEVAYPPAAIVYDPTFEKDMAIYRREVTLRVPINEGSMLPLQVEITSQGCADAGLCYSPSTHELTLTATNDGYKLSGEGVVNSVPAPLTEVVLADAAPEKAASASSSANSLLDLSDTGLAAYLLDASWWQIMLLAFGLGMLLSFTPCVLPMVPILLGIIAGQGAPIKSVSRKRGLGLAAIYVLGVSVVYTALGVVAGLLGASLAVWLQNPWILSTFAVLLFVLALSMFDVYQLQVPSGMQSRLQGVLSRIPGGRYSGVFLMGMLSALIVGPCVAAPLAGVLLFISQTGNIAIGAMALFAMAWGSGVLLLLVGATSGVLMPKAGAWMNTVKQIFGWLLIATALWMLTSVLPTVWFMLGWAVLAAWLGLLLGVGRSHEAGTSAGKLFLKALGWLSMCWAIFILVSVASGGRSVMEPLKHWQGSGSVMGVGSAVTAPTFQKVETIAELEEKLANSGGRTVMLDFYADWCVSCIEMEKFTFSDPAVAAKMNSMLLLQADVTANTPEHRALLKRFNLFGPPGIILFDAQGRELHDARVVGFMPADKFLRVLNSAN